MMYQPNCELDLHRLSRQSLQKRYESDEEAASESDAGGQDFVPSLVGSRRAGALDSDLSADENSHMDPDSDREDHLLAPYASGTKRPRPVSMDTVKQTSDATFVEDAYVFDPEEEMVLEIPSPDSPPALGSNMFLQPSIYVSPNTPPTTHPRSRSSSPSSIFSVENAEIHVAKKVTLIEPPTRPALVFINSLGSRSKGLKPRQSNPRSRGSPRDRESRVFMGKSESDLNIARMVEVQPSAPRAPRRNFSQENVAPLRIAPETSNVPEAIPRVQRANSSATINRVSEIPTLPYLPPSPRNIQPGSRSRIHLSGIEKSPSLTPGRPRGPTEPGSRPTSIRSNSNSSMLSHSRPESPFPDGPRRGCILDHNNDAASLLSRTCSAASPASSPTTHPKRAQATGPNTPIMLGNRTQMMRRMTRKHSAASSVYSLNSLRSEMDAATNPICTSAAATPSQPSMNTISRDSHVVRKPSQRRHARHNSAAPTGRGFMGLKLGKRSFTRV